MLRMPLKPSLPTLYASHAFETFSSYILSRQWRFWANKISKATLSACKASFSFLEIHWVVV